MTTLAAHKSLPSPLPIPKGDPGAMTDMAQACQAASELLADGGQAAISAVGDMLFFAPVASALRGTVRGNAGSANSLSRSLASFATQLVTGAEKLQDEIDAFNKRNAEIAAVKAYNSRVDAENALRKAMLPNPIF